MITGLALIAALSLASPQNEESDMTVPASCQVPLEQINYRTCADAAPKGSPVRSWALINLGTQAFITGDTALAVSLYDEATPKDGQQIYSDPMFHAFRGAAYHSVGRAEEALTDARTSWEILNGTRVVDPQYPPSTDPAYRSFVLGFILPILKTGNDPSFSAAFETYQGITVDDTDALIRRALVLDQLGDFTGSLAASEKAIERLPEDPYLKNNHCYTLVRAERAAEGLPYCEAAMASLPESAPVRHSYASALAQMGRCDEANQQMAEARRLDPASESYREELTCSE